MYSLLRCIAPPVGLGKNCPRRLAYKVCNFRASIRHTSLPESQTQHTLPAWFGNDNTSPLFPLPCHAPHSGLLDALVPCLISPDPSSWLGAGRLWDSAQGAFWPGCVSQHQLAGWVLGSRSCLCQGSSCCTRLSCRFLWVG